MTVSTNSQTTASTSIHAPKRLLYGPGPTQVDPRVYEVMTQNVVGHLDPYFMEVAAGVERMLRTVFGTKNEWTFPISATGSGGMQTAVANFVEPGMKVAIFAAGYFADRISEMAKRQGGNVVRLEKPWGEWFSDDEAREFISRERPQVVAYVQAETSTGVFQEGKAICEAAHEVGAIVIADCVTSLGAMNVDVDANGIDIAYSCTQKGLSCPPGLSPITVSPRAVERLQQRKTPCPSWYFDLKLVTEFLFGRKYHHTASATLFYALHEALSLVEEEGFERRVERHRRAHEAFVRGLKKLGVEMLVPEGHRICNLNTPRVPDGVNDAKVRSYLLDKHGMEVAGGFGPLAGRIFRVGIMGPLATEEGVNHFLECFGEALKG